MCEKYLNEPKVGQYHLIQSLFYCKVLKILLHLLNTVLKVKKSMVLSVSLFTLVILGLTWNWLSAAQNQERVSMTY